MLTLSQIIADFSLDIPFGALPERVIAKTKLLILDAIGLALAAAHEEVTDRVMAALPEFGSGGQCTVIGSLETLPVVNAPLINGMLIHAFDFDDTHHPLVIHNESVVVPAALAIAERQRASGEDFLAACAVGFETSLRVARGTRVSSIHHRGFHPTSICGVFGGSAAVGRLLGLTREQQVHAFGLAAAQGSGNMEWQTDGSWSKRFQPGWSAHGSVVGALLAKQGFTAPETALEGPKGFYATHVGADSFDATMAASGIGEEWELDNTEFKPYPCAGVLQATVRSGVEIHNRHDLNLGEIEDVECRLNMEGLGEVFDVGLPGSDYAAHFSIPFIAAVALTKGRLALADFEGASFRDPVITELASKVHIADDPTSGRPKYASGHIVVQTKDGRVLEHRQHIHPGHVDFPVTTSEILEKFALNASRILPENKVSELADQLLAIDKLATIHELADKLRIGGQRLTNIVGNV